VLRIACVTRNSSFVTQHATRITFNFAAKDNFSVMVKMVKFGAAAIFLLICLGAGMMAPHRSAAQPATPTPAPVAAAPPVAYVLLLDAPPAAEFLTQLTERGVGAAGATAATQQYIARLDQAQQTLLTSLETLGAPVLYRTQRVYNGVAVLATADQLAALADLPGVKTVQRLVPKTPDTTTSVPFLGAPALWQGFAGAPGLRGEKMRIAVIDTGVDYLHVDFGGPGKGYGQNDPTRIGDVPGFPGVKVITGYDFAGNAYNADPRSVTYNPIPAPDPDPTDCYGHGTHVAGIAAGFGVTAAQTTYTGPWAANTDFSALRIGPGVAPLASIVALKVFGCSGASSLIDLAIEWAVDPNGDGDFADRVDVINLSLGSTLGDGRDTTTIAAENAAAVGVVVVASAGNAFDYRFVTGSPSVGDRVVSVAATQHGVVRQASGAQRIDTIAAFSSRGPRAGDAVLKPDLAAPGAGIRSAANGSGASWLTLSGTSMAAPHVAGALALLRQLHPTWRSEEIKALAMNTAYPLVRGGLALTTTLYTPSRIGAGRIDLPAAVHAEAIAYAATPGRVSLSFGMPEVLTEYTAVQPLRVAAKGGRALTYTLSYFPITAAPGVTITLPVRQITAPAEGVAEAPVVFFAIAETLGRGATTGPGAASTPPYPRLDEASGHVLLWPAEGGWAADFGEAAPPVAAHFTYQPLDHTLAYTLHITGVAPASISAITLGAGQPGDERAPLYTLYSADDGALTSPLSGVLPFNPDYELLLAADGLYVEFTYATAPVTSVRGQLAALASVLHVPLHAAPQPVAARRTTPARIEIAPDVSAAFTVTGPSLAGSRTPTDVVALASVLQLAVQSPNLRPPGLPAAAPDLYDAADLSAVGVATDWAGAGADDARLYFGLATHAAWSSPNQVRFEVWIDSSGDGAADFRLFNSSREGYIVDQFYGDNFVSVLEDLRTGRRAVQEPLNGVEPGVADTRPFHSRVMALPVRAADLGLTTAQSVISYTVTSYHQALGDRAEEVIDRTPPRRFDLAQPALTVSGGDGWLLTDAGECGLSVKVALAGYAQQSAGGLLLLHYHNRVEEQAEVVEVRMRWPAVLYLPFTGK
jgi:subtilisin family serine protease